VENIGPSLMHTKFVLDVIHLAPFGNVGGSEVTCAKNCGQILHFFAPVKIQGGVGRMSE